MYDNRSYVHKRVRGMSSPEPDAVLRLSKMSGVPAFYCVREHAHTRAPVPAIKRDHPGHAGHSQEGFRFDLGHTPDMPWTCLPESYMFSVVRSISGDHRATPSSNLFVR